MSQGYWPDRAYRDGRLVMDSKQDLVDEIGRLRALLDDKQYIQFKADYNRGHLSHHGWLQSRESKTSK